MRKNGGSIMLKIAIVTDSNSGLTPIEAKERGIFVIPMPFMISGEPYYEDINLTQEAFYEKLQSNADISTSQPAVGEVINLWDTLLKEFDQIVSLPMSSGLSKTYETAEMLSHYDEYEGKVFVVNNQRISVTQRQAAFDAMELTKRGMNGKEIKEFLEERKFDSSIYIMVDTLKYLCKGGRVTPAGAAFGKLLGIKPVLQIQGEKLDAFAKVRGKKKAIVTMIEAMKEDIKNRFGGDNSKIHMEVAYTYDRSAAEEFYELVKKEFPNCCDYVMNPLSLSVSCHIGPGALAIACSKVI